MKNVFKQIIADFHESEVKSVKKRDLEVPLDSGKIVSIIGPRRAGKSYFLYALMHELMKQ
ncbi:MAG: hypothetical protein LBI53_00065 [Candidatus Peribacteria bacterium]|jgi:predicted AAA+ superfamily ATPase|nr:hypothetical protein [Candidatus Peribacteria bacterium]